MWPNFWIFEVKARRTFSQILYWSSLEVLTLVFLFPDRPSLLGGERYHQPPGLYGGSRGKTNHQVLCEEPSDFCRPESKLIKIPSSWLRFIWSPGELKQIDQYLHLPRGQKSLSHFPPWRWRGLDLNNSRRNFETFAGRIFASSWQLSSVVLP